MLSRSGGYAFTLQLCNCSAFRMSLNTRPVAVAVSARQGHWNMLRTDVTRLYSGLKLSPMYINHNIKHNAVNCIGWYVETLYDQGQKLLLILQCWGCSICKMLFQQSNCSGAKSPLHAILLYCGIKFTLCSFIGLTANRVHVVSILQNRLSYL